MAAWYEDKNTLKQLVGEAPKVKPAKYGYVRGADGLECVALNRAVTEKVGAFEGNVGSAKRSRKGRTYRAPNGRRYYVAGSLDVVAYRV